MMRKYECDGIVWIGPYIKGYNSNGFKKTKINDDQIYKFIQRMNSYNLCDKCNQSNHKYKTKMFAFIEYKKGSEYVIKSSYLTLDASTIYGPPKSFVDCFKIIMSFVKDEHASSIKNNCTSSVGTCLACHEILEYNIN